jgi:hypothetical protein
LAVVENRKRQGYVPVFFFILTQKKWTLLFLNADVMIDRKFSLALYLITLVTSIFSNNVIAQPTMETGGQKMPDEWLDKSTGHKVIRLTRRTGNNMSFYFHNNPYAGDKMIFYGTDLLNTHGNDSVKQETGNIPANNKQL